MNATVGWRRILVARAASVVTVLIGVMVLAGWALNIDSLTSVVTGWSPMVPATALAFVLAAVSLGLVAARIAGPQRRVVSQICAALVALVGILRLIECLSGWDRHLSFLGFEVTSTSTMSPATALNLVLLGAALLLTEIARASATRQALSVLTLLIGWLGLSRYVYEGQPLVPYTEMALHTAIVFIILSFGVLAARSQAGLVQIFASDGAGGTSARRLLPAALILPLVLACLPLYAEHAGWLGHEAGMSLFSLTIVIIFGTLIYFNAVRLDRADLQRNEAQRELSASRQLLRQIVESSDDAIISKTLKGIITSWNCGAEKIFGFSAQEAVGQPMQMLIPPERLEEEPQILEQLARGQSVDHFETVRVRKDGTRIDISTTISPVKDGRGQVVGASKIARDITKRKQMEAALHKSEVQYRSLFETLIEGFCTIEVIFDACGKPVDYRFLEINPAFEKQTGLRDAQGKLMRDIAPDHEAHWFEIYGKVALTGEPTFFENEAKALGRHFDVCAYRVGGADSRKVAILFNDITERKGSQRKLQAQLERLRLLEQITRAIGERQDLTSIFQVVIRTLEDQLPIDFSCICLYEPADYRLTVAHVGLRNQALAEELALTEQAHIDIDENGLSRCVLGQLTYEADVGELRFPFPQRLAAGGLRALVAAPLLVESKVFGVLIAARREARSFSSGECEFLRQLSEHVALAAHQAQLYDALQKAYEDLRATQQAVMQQERLRALGQMASGIAHDINNAISPVALYTDSLLEREPNLSAQGRGQLQTIQRAIHDVAATVARMREFYRQRDAPVNLAAVHLNQLVHQVVDLTRARWCDMPQQRGIVIELRTELAADPPAVTGVEGEIREALTNLIFNAVDAMPEGGTLTLRTHAVEPGHVQVEVSDTGTGMNEDARRRCLEPFFTTKGERGTGLGLAMVYGMVQRHSADIEIDSAMGQGTTIRVSFAAAATATAIVQSATVHSVPSPLRILVVDDDPVLLKSLRDTLEGDGHTIVTANGGQEGIDFFRAAQDLKETFDVVLTDLGMPHIDGRQVASRIKMASPSTPVIMLTGWGQRLVAEGDIPPHVDHVLNKPPKLRDLREALASCCDLIANA
jgi:PAS domain S-box-containing protein